MEMGLVKPHPLLPEKDGARIVYFDGQGDEKIHRGQHRDAAGGKNDIQKTLPVVTIQTDSLFLFGADWTKIFTLVYHRSGITARKSFLKTGFRGFSFRKYFRKLLHSAKETDIIN